MVLCKIFSAGRPINLDNSRARACYAYSMCGWGLLGHVSLVFQFSLLSHSHRETAQYRPPTWEVAVYLAVAGDVSF